MASFSLYSQPIIAEDNSKNENHTSTTHIQDSPLPPPPTQKSELNIGVLHLEEKGNNLENIGTSLIQLSHT